MSELYEKSLAKLELDKVLEMLAECAGSEEAKTACRGLRPVSDLEDVKARAGGDHCRFDLSTKKGYPGFGDVKDVSASLERADRGGCLQPKELLEIGGVLRCARTVKSYVAEDEKPTVLNPLFGALTPNKYLEDRIFGAILSEEEIGGHRQSRTGGHPAAYAHPVRENPGQPAKGHFLPGLFQVPPGTHYHHSAGPVCRAGEKRVQE